MQQTKTLLRLKRLARRLQLEADTHEALAHVDRHFADRDPELLEAARAHETICRELRQERYEVVEALRSMAKDG